MSRSIDFLPSLARAGGPESGVSRRLIARIAGRTAARLGRLQKALAAPALRRAVPEGAAVLAATRDAVRALPPAEKERLLHGPDLRGFLVEGEIWVDVLRQAERLEADPSDLRARSRLFERLASTEHLVTLLPRGHIDRGCAARAGRFARRRLRSISADLAAFLTGVRLTRPAGGPLDVRLEFHEEPELGRPPDRIDFGTLQTAAGPLSLTRPARGKGARGADHSVRIRIDNRSLIVRPRPGPAVVLPAAASRLRFPAGATVDRSEPTLPGTMRLTRRATIPGTPIILAPTLHSSPRRLSVGRQVAGLGDRLGRALRALGIVWPEMRAEVVRRTTMVVPIRETGLVSYSLAARPGISFINVSGKQVIELADDLLHESAHHLLHDIQEIATLLVPGPETADVQAFDSPWRGTRRPLHGLLHGCYTFLFRAELLIRLRDVRGAPSRLLASLLGRAFPAFARREAHREMAMLRDGLRQLETAARAGLLTAAGGRLMHAMGIWHARLTASRTSDRDAGRNR
jgi:HEXXH motif-containing protein